MLFLMFLLLINSLALLVGNMHHSVRAPHHIAFAAHAGDWKSILQAREVRCMYLLTSRLVLHLLTKSQPAVCSRLTRCQLQISAYLTQYTVCSVLHTWLRSRSRSARHTGQYFDPGASFSISLPLSGPEHHSPNYFHKSTDLDRHSLFFFSLLFPTALCCLLATPAAHERARNDRSYTSKCRGTGIPHGIGRP